MHNNFIDLMESARVFLVFFNNLPLFILNQKSSLVDIPMLQFSYAYIQRQEAKSK